MNAGQSMTLLLISFGALVFLMVLLKQYNMLPRFGIPDLLKLKNFRLPEPPEIKVEVKPRAKKKPVAAIVPSVIKIPPQPKFIPGRTYNEGQIMTHLVYANTHVVFYVRNKRFRHVHEGDQIKAIIYHDFVNQRLLPLAADGSYDCFLYSSQEALDTAKSYLPAGEVINVVFVKPNSRDGKALRSIYGGLFGGLP